MTLNLVFSLTQMAALGWIFMLKDKKEETVKG